ncbi:Rad3-like ATP dependent DNA binding helicase [Encephalitozoon intestinalis ATCC 50506]|uniref:ATP-dependent DNA helicase CHL1 n=1 Tax=Encephalitozoon intestinalis (strain ATCC 50506) TaxID=876142 RepID=E0S8S7_ENCIT|nr:Rad3-like ATP dependent DNA binding helicase [Encephalitozoon intestinalis ATCC 50506]ADM12044.1 Rad3-like ATP dependent DNA binding helicase [Encephalitozoon intestinalis ATCC 50506]UTX45833.1 Rad3/XPD DNA repair helicase [Encephalitozoon intestinalis]
MDRIELYESQKLFIEDARRVIDGGSVGIFSSPTGTGKTISLLSAVADYMDIEETEMDCRNRMLEKILFQGSRKAVFYCTRTHTQLAQAINELKKLGVRCNSVVLGSRKIYCLNEEIRKYKSSDEMNEACKEAVKEGKCMLHDGCEEFDGYGVIDVEDLLATGGRERFCPYYTARSYSQQCDIVFLPYQLLFTREGRKSADIDVKGSIVVVDEAHNIYDSVIQMNTASISFGTVDRYVKAMELYKKRYGGRMKRDGQFERVMEVLKKIGSFRCVHCRDMEGDEGVMGVSEFLLGAGIEDFNMLEIEDYIAVSGISRKLEGFEKDLNMKLPEISKFLSLLTMSDKSGRILYSSKGIKFTPLDASMYFEDVLECRSLLLAGGTMEPIDQLVSALRKRSPKYFSYGSVCKDFLPIVIRSGPSGKEIVVNYETRESPMSIKDVASSILNLSNAVRSGGMVCFLPSKAYLKILKEACGDTIGSKKALYEDSVTFEEYVQEVRRSPCILFAVMGGSLSEGVNFNDSLCRLLVVVGVPYPSQDLELKERAKFNGSGYTTAIAMKTVNQALGRALRHRDDYAVLVLLDKRYVQLSRLTSPWIREKIIHCNFGDGLFKTNKFLNKDRCL